MKCSFRTLKADEIEVRISTVKDNGMSLLLYKDARCDMNILDETVGAERWQRSHELINGNLFCNVGINFINEQGVDRWVWKQDVGTESYTEKEKGQASESFKRACFNWGIGRELYTAPFIWVTGCNKTDKFKVKKICYTDNRKISRLTIIKVKYDAETIVFDYDIAKPKTKEKSKLSVTNEHKADERAHNIDLMYVAAENNGFNREDLTIIVMGKYSVKPDKLTSEQAIECANNIVANAGKLRQWVEKQKKKGVA